MQTENHILPVDDGGEQLSKKAFVHLFLFAWYESIPHQHERVPLLAATVGVPPAEMLSHSIVPYADRVQGGGMIRGTTWNALFHGIGDGRVFHPEDGRVVEISFGP